MKQSLLCASLRGMLDNFCDERTEKNEIEAKLGKLVKDVKKLHEVSQSGFEVFMNHVLQ
jgi:hypothetical protein